MVQAELKLPTLLVRPAEAARLLSVSQRTLWTLTQSGVLPCVRLGRSVRYSPAALEGALVQIQTKLSVISKPTV